MQILATIVTRGVLALAGLLAAGPAAAQRAAPPAPAQVMVLGTYHFANPGLDVIKTEVADVLSPAKQAEILQVVEALARFQPTRIVVEAPLSSAARLDSLYGAYRAGRLELPRNEVFQLGFRLAAKLGHPRVYPVDHPGEFPFGPMMEYARKHDPGFVELAGRTMAQIAADENRRQREMTIGQNLYQRNDPEDIRKGHGLYLTMARVGAGDTYVGADLVAKWYDRNIRIFSNVQRIAEPGDRILMIFGSGHSAILRELVSYTPGMILVEARDFLPPG